MATARVRPNCLKKTPLVPPMKLTGTKTEAITRVMETMAGAISPMAEIEAARGSFSPPSSLAWTASTTTMASSTTMPMASTSAKRVSRLMEKPMSRRKKKVPMMATGTAMAGIRVARKFCRNRNTTRKTRMKASIRVCTTFSMDASRKSLASIW